MTSETKRPKRQQKRPAFREKPKGRPRKLPDSPDRRRNGYPNSTHGISVKKVKVGGRSPGGLFKSYRRGCRRLGIPELALRDLEAAKQLGEQLLRELDELEAALTQFERDFPDLAKQLPWYEAREEYKALKAKGRAPRATWWQALAALESCQIQDRQAATVIWHAVEQAKRKLDKQ